MAEAVAERGLGSRIATLDIIRGIAVMGILSVNIVDFALPSAVYLSPAAMGWPDPASLWVWAANMILIDGKMRALFSMLFGASMLLVIDRAEASGRSGWSVHWRRMVVLLVIGFVHAVLIWHGDILTLYAMTGLVAYRFRNASLRKLIGWAIGLTIVSMLLFGLVTFGWMQLDHAAHAAGASASDIHSWNENAKQFYPSAQELAQTLARMRGSWLGVAAHQGSEAGAIPIMNLVLMPETLGLMLFGMAAYRSGLFTGAWDDRRLKRLALWSIPLGIVAHAVVVWADLSTDFYFGALFGGFVAAVTPFRIVQAFGYAALIVLATRRMGPLAQRVAAVGRAAFTNYLGTSLICTFIFYGWGLGYYGHWTRAEAWLVAPAVWLAMLAWSKPWLDRFNYGPFEWPWRSLARMEFQPMRKRRGSGAVAAAA